MGRVGLMKTQVGRESTAHSHRLLIRQIEK
jgi:hypothetical protein